MRDRLWFFANVRAWANAAVVDGIFANRFAGDASHWDYAADPSIEARTAEARKIYRRPPDAQLTPRNRVTFSHDYQRRCGGSTLTAGGDGCRQAGGDWVASGRTFGADTVSPETFPGYHDFPYNTTQATYSAPISSRTLLEAGYSRFAYGYARFGMAAPDGLMDLIPVTEQTGIYGRPNFSYRGVFDPLDFGFNDNDALNSTWRAALSYVTGAHNMKVGYTGLVHRGAQRPRAERHAAALHVQLQRARDRAVHGRGRPSPVPGQRLVLPVAALGPARSHADDRAVRAGPVDGRAADAAGRHALRPRLELGAGRGQRHHRDVALQPAADHVRADGQRPRLQRHHAAVRRRLRPVRQRQDGAQGQPRQVSRSGDRPTASTAPTIRRRASSRASGRGRPRARGWTDGNRNFVVDCDLLNPAAQDNLATGGDLCAAVGGVDLNFGNANPNTTTINPDILGGWGVRPYDWQFGASVQHELLPRLSVEVGYNRRWWGNFFVTDNVLTTAADYDTYSHRHPAAREPAGRRRARRQFVAITPAASSARRAELHDERDRLRRRAHGVLARRGLHRDGAAGQRPHGAGRHQHRPRRPRQLRRHRGAARAARHRAGRFVRRHREVDDVVPGPGVVHGPEDRRAGQRQHAVARDHARRRRGHQRAVAGRQLRRAEHRSSRSRSAACRPTRWRPARRR